MARNVHDEFASCFVVLSLIRVNRTNKVVTIDIYFIFIAILIIFFVFVFWLKKRKKREKNNNRSSLANYVVYAFVRLCGQLWCVCSTMSHPTANNCVNSKWSENRDEKRKEKLWLFSHFISTSIIRRIVTNRRFQCEMYQSEVKLCWQIGDSPYFV